MQWMGYSLDEVKHTFFRKLQGPMTDRLNAHRLNVAFVEKTPVFVQIWNYRKNGSSILNNIYMNFFGPENKFCIQSCKFLTFKTLHRFSNAFQLEGVPEKREVPY